MIISLIYWFRPNKEYWKRQWYIAAGLLIGSVIPDVQGFAALFLGWNVPLHGFSHSIIGAIVYSIIIVFLIIVFIKIFTRDLLITMVTSRITFVIYLFGMILFGILLFHLIPDVVIWPDMAIFAPFSDKRFGEVRNYSNVARILAFLFIIGIIITIIRITVPYEIDKLS